MNNKLVILALHIIYCYLLNASVRAEPVFSSWYVKRKMITEGDFMNSWSNHSLEDCLLRCQGYSLCDTVTSVEKNCSLYQAKNESLLECPIEVYTKGITFFLADHDLIPEIFKRCNFWSFSVCKNDLCLNMCNTWYKGKLNESFVLLTSCIVYVRKYS